MEKNEKFLKVFYELLDENGLNRRQFADKSEIPYPTVIGWTNQGRLPDYTALNKLADFFGCSADYLLGREENSAFDGLSKGTAKKQVNCNGLSEEDCEAI